MITPQLLDYIKGQMQKGATPEMIKGALTKAGWAQNDIDEALNVANAAPASSPAAATSAAAQPAAQPAAAWPAASTTPLKSIDIQPAQPAAAAAASPSAASDTAKVSFEVPDMQSVDMSSVQMDPAASTSSSMMRSPARPSSFSMKKALPFIVMGILVLAAGGAAAFFYIQYSGSAAKMQTYNSQIAAMQVQLTNLGTQNQQLTTQVASLTTENADLDGQLSLFVAPSDTSTSTAELPMSVKGTISASGSTFLLTTDHNIIITVKNSKDPGVALALQPLAGQQVQLDGTHAPASRLMTVQKVNGNDIVEPATASSTTPAASSTSSSTPKSSK